MSPVSLDPPAPALIDVPSSRQLGALLQEELALSTGLEARWAAERMHGNRGGLALWAVPFSATGGGGRFLLRWDPDLQPHLAGRLGPIAARPEFLGSVLRAAAGRWAAAQPRNGRPTLRLEPSGESEAPTAPPRASSSAALLLDGHVLEIVFELDRV